MKLTVKSNYLRVLAILFVFSFAACEQGDQLIEPNLPETEEEVQLIAPQGDGELIQVRLQTDEGNSSGAVQTRSKNNDPYYVDGGFLMTTNQSQNTPGNIHFYYECCIDRGNWGDGVKYYIKTPSGTYRPAYYFVDLTKANDAISQYGLTAMWRGGAWVDMPFNENLDPVKVTVDGVEVNPARLDLSEWGTEEVVLITANLMEGSNLDAEYCWAAQQYGHVEVLNEFKPICLTLTTTSGQFAVNMVAGGLADAQTDELVMPIVEASKTEESTELVQIRLLGGIRGDDNHTLWTVPDWAVHGDNSLGCPISLEPRDCDDDHVDPVDCPALEPLNPIRSCAEEMVNLPNNPPAALLAAVEALHGVENGTNGEYGLRFDPSWGEEGVWIYGRIGCKTGRWIFDGERLNPNGSGLTSHRMAIGWENEQWGLYIQYRGAEGKLFFTPWDDQGVEIWAITPDGTKHLWMLSSGDWIKGSELFLLPLQRKSYSIRENGNEIGTIISPMEATAHGVALGLNILVNGVDDADGKMFQVEREECFYRLLTDKVRWAVDGLPTGYTATPGISLDLSSLGYYVFDENDTLINIIDVDHNWAPVKALANGESFGVEANFNVPLGNWN